MTTAYGSDAALNVERARAMMRTEQASAARLRSLEALEDAPGMDAAWRVYLRSSVLAGWGPVAEAELKYLASTDPQAEVSWTWWQIRQGRLEPSALDALSEGPDGDAAVARAWVAWTWQGREDALQLLPPDSGDPMVQRLRLRVLAELGMTGPIRQEARGWLREQPAHPDVLTELWEATQDTRLKGLRKTVLRTVTRRAEAPDVSSLLLYRSARLMAAARSGASASELANRIAERGLEPPLPRRGWGDAMREGMGRVLAMNPEGDLPNGTPSELLRITVVRSERLLSSRNEDAAVEAFTELRAVSDSTDAALAHAELLLSLDRSERARQAAEEAARLAVGPEVDDVARLDTARQAAQLARALGLQGEAWLALGRPDRALKPAAQARALDPQPRWWALSARAAASPELQASKLAVLDPEVMAVVDSLLNPMDANAWSRRAQSHADTEHWEMAFAAGSMAAALGSTPEDFSSWYRGPATASVASEALFAALQDSLDAHSSKVAEWVAEHQSVADAMSVDSSGLVLGQRVPEWEVKGRDGGILHSESLRGRPYVLTLWASWCGPCKLELPELDRVASAGPAPWLAVSVDAHESAFLRASRRGGWDDLVMGWAPDLSRRLGVDRIPTTVVADAEGRVVHIERGYSPSGVERVREAMAVQAQP